MNYVIPTIDWSVLMPTLIVAVTGIVALLIEMARPKQNNNLIIGVSLAGLLLGFWSLLGQLGQPPTSTMSGLVYRDQFAVLTQLMIVGVTFLCFLFSEAYLRQKRIAFGEFYPLALWSASGAMIMVGTESLLMLFIGLEVLSISLYCLAGMARGEQRSEESALKYFLLGSFASAFLLYGIAWAYGASGSISLDAFRIIQDLPDTVYPTMGLFALGLMLIGLGFKTSLVPFHQWTPDVYQGAPTNVTAFMGAVSKIAAFGALYRVLSAAAPYQDAYMPVLVVIAILTMTVGNLAALVQKDVKRALGYSGVAHAGYILVGLLAHLKMPDKISLTAVIFYLISYSVMTVGAFAIIGLTAKSGKEGTRTQDLNGLWKTQPLAAVALFVCLVSLIGVPPTAGFWGKAFIFGDALTAGLTTLAIALAINSVISTFYYWQIAKAAFVDENTAVQNDFAPMSGGLKATAVFSMAGVLVAAFVASPLLTLGQSAGMDRVDNETKMQVLDPRVDVIPDDMPRPSGFAAPGGAPPPAAEDGE